MVNHRVEDGSIPYPSDASFKSLLLLSAALSGDGGGSITPVKNIPRRGKMGCLVELLWHWSGEGERETPNAIDGGQARRSCSLFVGLLCD